MISEKEAWTINGYLGLVIFIVMIVVGVLSFIYGEWTMGIIFFAGATILMSGFTIIQPNQSVIVQFTGNYIGTYRQPGIVLFVPFSKKIHVSLRERIFKSETIEVHDITGSSVPISLVVLFKIDDAAKAVYDVENMEKFIAVQSEMSVRSIMTEYAHDDLLTDDALLQALTERLKQDLYKRLKRAGVSLTEIRAIPLAKPKDSIQSDTAVHLSEKIIKLLEQENALSQNK